MHPRYNSRTIDNDVAVIRLASNVGLTRGIGLSRLPRRSDVGVNLVGKDDSYNNLKDTKQNKKDLEIIEGQLSILHSQYFDNNYVLFVLTF